MARTAARKVFDSVDNDRSGFVSRAELEKKLLVDKNLEQLLGISKDSGEMPPMPPRTAARKIDSLLRAIDIDRSGQITWEEFWLAVKYHTAAM